MDLKDRIEKKRPDPDQSILQDKATKEHVALTQLDAKQRRILKGHFGKIYAVHWAKDSRHLVSASGWKAYHLECIHNQQSSRYPTQIIMGHDLCLFPFGQLGCLWWFG